MRRWNWGILGQGAVAVRMAEALMKEYGTVYAVVGCHMEKVTTFASACTVEYCYDIESLLTNEQVDIIYIATPHTYRYDYIMRALQHGEHVLCEEAITANYRQLQEIMVLVQEKQLILMEAMTIFRMLVFVKAKELVE